MFLVVGVIVTVLFNVIFGHLWGRLYTSQHWQQLPNPEFMRMDLANYQGIDEAQLKRFNATIEVVDDQLQVIEVYGDDSRLGYRYTIGEFLKMCIRDRSCAMPKRSVSPVKPA